jgi:glycosidase
MIDFGYDIYDHCVIDPLFGSMDEFDEVLAACVVSACGLS